MTIRTRNLQWLLPAMVFAALMAFYAPSLNPVFNADDSPETAACAFTLGIQHPPGYPLQSLLGRLAALALPGNPGFRGSLLAALAAAVAGALVTAILWRVLSRANGCRPVLGVRQPEAPVGPRAWMLPAAAAMVGGLWLGLSKTFFSQALSSKGGVYTLQAALIAWLFYWAERWEEQALLVRLQPQASRLALFRPRAFLMACLAMGLGLASHWETQLLVAPALAVYVLFMLHPVKVDAGLRRPASRTLAPLVWGALLAAAGVSLWLYLPLRARLAPALNWGAPATWEQFKWVVMRQEYTDLETGFLKSVLAAVTGGGTWDQAGAQWAPVAAQGARMLHNLLTDMGPGWLLVLPGLWALLRMRRGRQLLLWAGTAALFALAVTFYFHLKPEMIWIMDVFMIPAYLCMALLLGVGLGWMLELIADRLQRPALASGRGTGASTAAALALMALALPLAMGASNQIRLSQRRMFWAYDFGRDMLGSAAPGGIVLAEGDFHVMPCYYLQTVEGRRPDVDHITSVFLSLPWGIRHVQAHQPGVGLAMDPDPYPSTGARYTAAMGQVLAANAGRRPLYCSLYHQTQDEMLPQLKAGLAPQGLLMAFASPRSAGPSPAARAVALRKTLRTRHWEADIDAVHPSTAFMLGNYATASLELANYLAGLGAQAPGDCMPIYAEAVRLAPKDTRAECLTHWGIALGRRNRLAEAQDKFRAALAMKPLYEAWTNLAGVANTQKRYADGEQAARKALELKPEAPEAWNNLAIAQYYQGRRDDAVRSLEQAARLNPGNAQIAGNLKAIRGR